MFKVRPAEEAATADVRGRTADCLRFLHLRHPGERDDEDLRQGRILFKSFLSVPVVDRYPFNSQEIAVKNAVL
jgi:hypothetical protein